MIDSDFCNSSDEPRVLCSSAAPSAALSLGRPSPLRSGAALPLRSSPLPSLSLRCSSLCLSSSLLSSASSPSPSLVSSTSPLNSSALIMCFASLSEWLTICNEITHCFAALRLGAYRFDFRELRLQWGLRMQSQLPIAYAPRVPLYSYAQYTVALFPLPSALRYLPYAAILCISAASHSLHLTQHKCSSVLHEYSERTNLYSVSVALASFLELTLKPSSSFKLKLTSYNGKHFIYVFIHTRTSTVVTVLYILLSSLYYQVFI